MDINLQITDCYSILLLHCGIAKIIKDCFSLLSIFVDIKTKQNWQNVGVGPGATSLFLCILLKLTKQCENGIT